MLWLSLGCWQPDAYTPPPAAQVEASDVLEGTAEQIQPPSADGEPTPEGEAAEPAPEGEAAEAAPEGEAAEPAPEEPPVEAPPVAAPVSPWAGRTVGRPLTVVDDAGAPLQVIGDGVAVTVLMEGEDRVKVRCDGCAPVIEGWLQKRAVRR